MFERFTDRARRVVVLAQEEARLLDHNYIGTEHVLLGLLNEAEGVAAQVLQGLGIDLEDARRQVVQIVGRGEHPPTGHIPFTPRAKKVLELSLREALQLGHNYIGTEHILLGMVREGEGVAAQVLLQKTDLTAVREAVRRALSGGDQVHAEGAEPAGEQEVEPALAFAFGASPRCPGCRGEVAERARYQVVEVPPAEGEGGPVRATLVSCSRCGRFFGLLPAAG